MQNSCAPNRSYLLPVFVLFCVLSTNAATTNNDLLAHFKLDNSAEDSAGKCADFELSQTSIIDGSLYCNGCYENSGAPRGYKANARVPALSYDAFTVSLDFHPIDFRPERNSGIIDEIMWFVLRGHLP